MDHEDLYVENRSTGRRKGPFADMDDAKEAAQSWAESGEETYIHDVLDGEIQKSWEYDGDEISETSKFEGDDFLGDEEEEIVAEDDDEERDD